MAGLKQVFVQGLTEVSTTEKDALGDIRWEGNKAYKYVKFQNTTATVAGVANDMCGYVLAGYANHTVCCDASDMATKPIGAGICLAAVTGTSGTAYYIWIQVKGPATIATNLAGTPADGDALFLSTTDLTLTLATAADDPVCAYADDDSVQLVVLDCVL